MVIPLKWSDGLADNVAEMTVYLNRISLSVAGITVVDGSSASTREEHRRAWGSVARVIPPDSCLVDHEFGGSSHPRRTAASSQLNGKVVGALTGIHASRQELVILADDDVRHTAQSVRRLVSALATADLVRPVNVYDSWPWQAQWDGARSLVNVALGTDWPGTFALRRSTILGCGGWSTDVLFENLELWRTVKTFGGRVIDVGHLVVPRRAPDLRQFWGQRVRQAYDDLAQPARLLTEMSILPGLVLVASRRVSLLGLWVASVVLLAGWGRHRVGAERVPRTVPLWAPVWVLERGVCVWLAILSRLRGGARYHGGRLRKAANAESDLRARWVAGARDGTGREEPTTHVPEPGSTGLSP